MQIKITTIGKTFDRDNGTNEYLLVTSTEDELDEKTIYDEIMPRYYRECSGAGDYFCTSMQIVKQQFSSNDFIVTIHHRYDI